MTHPPRPLAGILWMVTSGLCFVGVTAVVKIIGSSVPPAQAGFLRYLLGLVFLVPLLSQLAAEKVPTATRKLFWLRGAFHTVAVMLWFYAMTKISLAEVTAMNYLAPVYITLGAAVFLGETLALRRLMAVLVALVGALIILRPGLRELSPGHIAMLFAAVGFAASYLIAKRTTDAASPKMVWAMLSVAVTTGLAPFAAMVWVTPSLTELGWLMTIAALAQAGHYAMTMAFSVAPVTVTQPVTFLQLVWATLLGWIAFDEGIDPFVVAGGIVILSAVTYITWRESVLRRATTPQKPPT